MVRDSHGKILRSVACFLLAALLIAAWERATCAPTGSVTYKDKLGRSVTVPLPVRRAVFLISYDLVPVLGTWDRVVGVARWAYDNDVVRQSNPAYPFSTVSRKWHGREHGGPPQAEA